MDKNVRMIGGVPVFEEATRAIALEIIRPITLDREKGLKLVMSGNNRTDIKVGMKVKVVQKQDQRSGNLTDGVVSAILTKSGTHPHGIKVRLQSGIVGRVKEISND